MSWRTWWSMPYSPKEKASASLRRLMFLSWQWSTWGSWRDSRCWQSTPALTWTDTELDTPLVPLKSPGAWPPLEWISLLDPNSCLTLATLFRILRPPDTRHSLSMSLRLPRLLHPSVHQSLTKATAPAVTPLLLQSLPSHQDQNQFGDHSKTLSSSNTFVPDLWYDFLITFSKDIDKRCHNKYLYNLF